MPLAAVFGGGNALGAFDAGAAAALAESGHALDHIAGASAGAMIAAIYAGNPPEGRTEALRRFWADVAQPGLGLLGDFWQRPLEFGSGIAGRLLGRPKMFRPNLSSLLRSGIPSLYDLAPLRKTLSTCIDFGRLNQGDMQVSLLAVGLANGVEKIFCNREGALTVDHILASSALLPDFPPVEIGGEIYVDGGMAANTPVDLVLAPPQDGLTCLAVDPFALSAALPDGILEGRERQMDLIYALQTRRSLAAQSEIWRLSGAQGAVWRIEYNGGKAETAMKGFSFNADILRRRWNAGFAGMQAALHAWQGAPPPAGPGLALHTETAGEPA